MHCAVCYTVNEPRAVACTSCGAKLAFVCSGCGSENSVGARFCSWCALPLSAPTSPFAEAGERRQLTVLFCDLVGSVALSRRLDPDDWHGVVTAYHGACARVIRAFHGHVAQLLGDGVLAYFGYPVASEDGPRWAVQAGLALLEAVQSVGSSLTIEPAVDIKVRIGIHTGPVIVANIGERQESLALGDTPNLAARIQAEAEPGSVVVSDATFRLTQGFFTVTSLGLRQLKGVSDSISLYRVDAESGAKNRIEAGIRMGLTPFVGHEAERAVLAQHWSRAAEGSTSTVVLSGEPGIGKSRHVDMLKEGLRKDRFGLLECRCSLHHQGTPLYPFIDLLERHAKLGPELSNESKAARLEEAVGEGDDQDLQLLAALLQIPLGPHHRALDLPPPARRAETFSALRRWLRRSMGTDPTLFVVEDLHWADPSTLELIEILVANPSFERCLMILTARPEFRPPWPKSSHWETLTIGRLDDKDTRSLVSFIAKSRALPEDIVAHLLKRADGVPLFLEEMTKAVIESGSVRWTGERFERVGAFTPETSPSTLQDSLMARFDRLGASKAIVQLAAALGREFSFELLRAVAAIPDQLLHGHLRRLGDAELILREDESGSYVFKHALIQEVAYQSLLRGTRQELHRRIGLTLRDQFPEVSMRQPEWLAHHFAAGSLPREAIGYFQIAGQRAIAASAFPEAIGHFGRGLELLSAVPAEERARYEINLRSGIGHAFLTTKGFSSNEVEETYTRAAALCDELGESNPVRVLYGIWAVQFVRSDLAATLRMVSHFQRIAQRAENSGPKLVAHSCIATWAFWRGNYELSLEHAARAGELCDASSLKKQHEELVPEYGLDCPLYGLYYLAWCNLLRGNTDSGRAHFERALRLAEDLGDPYVLVVTLTYGGAIAHDIGDLKRTAELADRSCRLAAQASFPFWLAGSLVQSGFAAAKLGDQAAGIERMKEGLALFRRIGTKASFPYYASYLCDVYVEAGLLDEALVLLEEVLAMMQTNLDCNYEPELLRIKAKALARRQEFAESDALFQRALTMARDACARLLELRVETTRVECRLEGRRRQRDLDSLGKLCQSFTEGLDAPVLGDARRLLELA